jgi:competence protein ComEC
MMHRRNEQPSRVVEMAMAAILAAATGGAGVALIAEGSRSGSGQNRAAEYAAIAPIATRAPAATSVTVKPRKTKTAAPARATRKPTPRATVRKPKPRKVTTPKPTATRAPVTYANCGELRRDYPGGVAATHPAYRSKMDRDKDGWACER